MSLGSTRHNSANSLDQSILPASAPSAISFLAARSAFFTWKILNLSAFDFSDAACWRTLATSACLIETWNCRTRNPSATTTTAATPPSATQRQRFSSLRFWTISGGSRLMRIM
jgi:hypothetical protein